MLPTAIFDADILEIQGDLPQEITDRGVTLAAIVSDLQDAAVVSGEGLFGTPAFTARVRKALYADAGLEPPAPRDLITYAGVRYRIAQCSPTQDGLEYVLTLEGETTP